MDTQLETRRLMLRPIRAEDLAQIHALFNEPAVRRYLFDDRVLTRDEVSELLERSKQSFSTQGFGLWLVFDKQGGDLAGFAGLLASEGDAPPNLVYGTRPDLVGGGIATEAAEAVLGHAFAELELVVVTADVDEPNQASVRVLEKLGMSRVRRAIVNDRPLLYFERRARA